MDNESANYYTREVMVILVREFQSPDEEMRKIVLKVVKQCCMTDGVEPHYIKEEILPHFFKHFWNQRMALDRRNFRQVCLVKGRQSKRPCGVRGKGSSKWKPHGIELGAGSSNLKPRLIGDG